MIVTARVLEILRCVACYGVLTAPQIRSLCFPNIQSDGSNVRSRIRAMVQQKLLNRAHMEIANPMSPLTAPVYYPSPLGVDVLATQEDRPGCCSGCAFARRTVNTLPGGSACEKRTVGL